MTLQLTARRDGTASLPRSVDDPAQLVGATDLIADLEHRGLIVVDHLTDEARSVAAEMSAVIAELTDPVWQSLDPDDSAATERVLNTVLEDLRDELELELPVVANGHPL